MISRYTVDEINKIWSEENKLQKWLDVEILVCKAWSKLGVIPKEDVDKIVKNSKVNIARMLEIEKETKHDVVAFTRMISETLGIERKWIHLGLTSTDVVDTAQNLLIKSSNEALLKHLGKIQSNLMKNALKYKETLISGRTHGMYGEPTSLGLKFLLWHQEIGRHISRIKYARKNIEVTKISGSMGNYAHLELEIEEYVAKETGLFVDLLSTQVTQRDRHAELVLCIANLASTFEKIATEIRLFQRSDVKEMSEGFSKGQKGSSSMPHKKNPISSENITGLSRFLRSFASMALENNVLWHERDISHSSNERIMFPDIFNIIVYSTERLNDVIENLYVDLDKIKEHIDSQNNIYFSQSIMSYLIKNTSKSREEIYDYIQNCTLECQKTGKDFKQILLESNIEKFIPNQNDLDLLFKNEFFLRNIDKIFSRVKNHGKEI